MFFSRLAPIGWILSALLGFSTSASAETVQLYFVPATPQIAYAAGDIKSALVKQRAPARGAFAADPFPGLTGKPSTAGVPVHPLVQFPVHHFPVRLSTIPP